MAKQGNGLGEDNAKSWNPASVGGYSRGLQPPKTGTVEDEKRKGAGQKA